MFNRLLTVLKRNKVRLLSLAIIFVAVVFIKVVLVDVVFVGQQFEKNRIITPWGEKIKSGNLSVSVAAYFELTDKDTNSVDNLVSAIYGTQILKRNQNIYNELKNLYSKWNMPLFFGELGFPKRNKASVHPWNPSPSNIENVQEQANCFQAYKGVFEKETWNLGFSVSKDLWAIVHFHL